LLSMLSQKAPRLLPSTLHPRNRLIFPGFFIGLRICFSFGSSSQDDGAEVRFARVSSLMRYGWSAFKGANVFTVCFRGTWLYNKSFQNMNSEGYISNMNFNVVPSQFDL
jgi:hypothetical protein